MHHKLLDLILILPAAALIFSIFTDVLWMSYLQLAISVLVFLTVGVIAVSFNSIAFFLGGFFFVDYINLVILITVSTLELFVAFYSFGYVRSEIAGGVSKRKFKFYYFWKNLFIFSMMVSILSNNLGIYWTGLEATTLATALLVSFNRTKESFEATWKYVIMCSVGIAIGLFAIVILYFTTSQVYGESMRSLSFINIMQAGAKLDKNFLMLSFILALVGFGTKVGFAPMHNWLPDAHSQGPSPVSALLSGVLLNTALLGILRFYQINAAAGIHYPRYFLICFGFLTIFVSAFSIIKQTDYKRLFAFSSMENMGIIALGFGIGGIAVIGSLLQIFFHALNKGLLFLSSGNVLAATHERRIDKIRNLSKNFPITGIVLLFGAMGISGMPPFAMFLGEIYIMTGVFRTDIWLGFLVFILLIFVFIGLFGKVLKMYVGKANTGDEEEGGELKTDGAGASHKAVSEAGLHPFIVYVPLIMLLFSSFLLFYIPYPFLHIIKSAAVEFGGKVNFFK
ncbi:MAG: hydantoin racemase [Candidatus Acidulodesulfobacterium acidiphilum]|uniref:Hydantoin racemase n=1 Tax=Candidatus Acidulodesulfobacterium acidiphilum TaxID=2597224 RepID=A0A520XHC5_9DELT|nr:MAG: hydantoin racemase [Candidatus Acidulodesulfobacterium acidiphilum]